MLVVAPAAAGEGGFVADRDVADGADLSGESDVVAEAGAAGDTAKRDDQAVFADDAIVADLDEIIDLGTLADDGLAEAGAVDGRSWRRFRRRHRFRRCRLDRFSRGVRRRIRSRSRLNR